MPIRTDSHPRHRRQKPLAWTEIREPGAYVELTTGTLYRVPAAALIEGAAPVVERQSESGTRLVRVDRTCPGVPSLVQISRNPRLFTLGARMLCVEHDIHPRF